MVTGNLVFNLPVSPANTTAPSVSTDYRRFNTRECRSSRALSKTSSVCCLIHSLIEENILITQNTRVTNTKYSVCHYTTRLSISEKLQLKQASVNTINPFNVSNLLCFYLYTHHTIFVITLSALFFFNYQSPDS